MFQCHIQKTLNQLFSGISRPQIEDEMESSLLTQPNVCFNNVSVPPLVQVPIWETSCIASLLFDTLSEELSFSGTSIFPLTSKVQAKNLGYSVWLIISAIFGLVFMSSIICRIIIDLKFIFCLSNLCHFGLQTISKLGPVYLAVLNCRLPKCVCHWQIHYRKL